MELASFSGLVFAKRATEIFLKELPIVSLVSKTLHILRACSASLPPSDLSGPGEGRVHQCEGSENRSFLLVPAQAGTKRKRKAQKRSLFFRAGQERGLGVFWAT